MHSRVSDVLGIDIPIIQAPMGYIARAQLASAVSNAGGMGIVETSSGRLDQVRGEIEKMPDLTDRPWGVNIAQLLIRDAAARDEILELVTGHGVRFVTTSAGDPAVIAPILQAAGVTVFHVVPTLHGAMKAVAAGVDGLIIEGVEGGGFKNPNGASTMVLVPLIAAATGLPIVAAGGISDGISMAAAFTLGAEAVQMGTRMLTAAESPVHDNWKQAVLAAAETDTIVVNRYGKPAMRALRTDLSTSAERADIPPALSLDGLMNLYFGGDLNAAYAMSGQVAGRIDEVLPVREILETAWSECQQRLRKLGEAASA
jgi:enoyl-[acyl-carrier protein] reductase II